MNRGGTDGPVRTLPKCLFYDVIGVVASFLFPSFSSFPVETFKAHRSVSCVDIIHDGRLRLFVTLSIITIIVNQQRSAHG